MASQELESLVEMIRSRPRPQGQSVAEMRAGFEQVSGLFPIPADVSVEKVSVGGVPGEIISAPGADPDRAVLYLHGGGYMIGSVATHRELMSRIGRESASMVLGIDYRLAPEHPFPAAVDDAVAAYRWLLARGIEPGRIVIAGDSAGGGLAVATLLALRDAGEPLPAAGVCLSPWVDLEGTGESMTTKAERDPVVQPQGVAVGAAAYLGGASTREPLASPLYANLAGLPPLLLQVGTAEILLDDSTRLAAAATEAGVEVTLEQWEDMIHVWQMFAEMLPEGQQAIERIGLFVREKTGARLTAVS